MGTCPQHAELEQGLARLAEAVVEKIKAAPKEGRDGEEMGAGERDRGMCAAFFAICIESIYKENKWNTKCEKDLKLQAGEKETAYGHLQVNRVHDTAAGGL